MQRSLVLIGFMGCGKSSVARALSDAARFRVLDLDEEIERRAHKSVAQIFADDGETHFRILETQALRETLQQKAVVATGGGVVTREENRELLKNSGSLVVYLRTSPPTLATRIRQQPGVRPLIDGDRVLDFKQTLLRVEELLSQREPWYLECADVVVETDGKSPQQIAREIALSHT